MACIHYTRQTPDEVRDAITAAGVIGSTPDEAIAKLSALRLADGRQLRVGHYLPDRCVIEATAEDARRTTTTRWSVNVRVSFMNCDRATGVSTEYSANDPL